MRTERAAGWDVTGVYASDPVPPAGAAEELAERRCCYDDQPHGVNLGGCDKPPTGLLLVGCVWKPICEEHLVYHEQRAVLATARPSFTQPVRP